LRGDQTKLNQELKNINVEITNEELDAKLIQCKKDIHDLEKKMKVFDSKDYVQIPEDKVNQAESGYSDMTNYYKKIKKGYFTVLDALSDGFEMNRKEFIVISYLI
jgi:hypothetical protein